MVLLSVMSLTNYKWYLWGSFTGGIGIVVGWFWLAAAAAAAKCNHKEDCKPPAPVPASVAEVIEVVDEEGEFEPEETEEDAVRKEMTESPMNKKEPIPQARSLFLFSSDNS